MRDKKLTVTLHIGGKQIDSLTPEQSERMAQRLSDTMSLYYTAHPEEHLKPTKKGNKKCLNSEKKRECSL